MIEGCGVHRFRLIFDAGDKDAFIIAAKTRQWDREKLVRILA